MQQPTPLFRYNWLYYKHTVEPQLSPDSQIRGTSIIQVPIIRAAQPNEMKWATQKQMRITQINLQVAAVNGIRAS